MVELKRIRTVDSKVSYRGVHASAGKQSGKGGAGRRLV